MRYMVYFIAKGDHDQIIFKYGAGATVNLYLAEVVNSPDIWIDERKIGG